MKNNIKKIGILGCGYECSEYIDEVLAPWITAKNNNLLGYKFVFSFVYGQFKEYVDINGLKSIKNPDWYEKYRDSIDYFFTPEPLTEVENRNIALKPLLDEGCDMIILLDLQDEIFTVDNISDILKYVELEKFISWFRFSYKNYVFDNNHYIKDPFTPPRLFRVNTNGYRLNGLFFDNDFSYIGTVVNPGCFQEKTISYKDLPSKTIPAKTAWIVHHTWPNTLKSKQKIEYQKKHFNNICSYDWDEENNKLIFNEDFYKKMNQELPIVLEDI